MSIEVRVGNLNGVKTALVALGRGIAIGALDGAEEVANQAAKLGSEITHQGTTKRLHQAWRVSRTTNKVSLTNIMPYAHKEFTRGGSKTRGLPPLGSHDPVPQIIDLVNANIVPAVMRRIQSGSTR